MTPANLEQDLKQGKLNSIYLFYGEELYLLHAEHFCRRGSNAVAFGIEGRFF